MAGIRRRATLTPVNEGSRRRFVLGFALSWPGLLRISALLELVLLAVVGIALLDREAMAFAVVVAASSAWLLRRPHSRFAVVARGLVFLDVEFFMVPATVSNIGNHEALGAVAAPLALSAVSAAGLVATVAFLATRGREGGAGALALALPLAAMLTVFAGLGMAGLGAAGGPVGPRPGDAAISATSVKFSTSALKVRSGVVTVYMTNNDLFWHTFSSTDLRISMSVPVHGHRRVTFNASPGTYEFHCAIPGHAAAGMVGKIVVERPWPRSDCGPGCLPGLGEAVRTELRLGDVAGGARLGGTGGVLRGLVG